MNKDIENKYIQFIIVPHVARCLKQKFNKDFNVTAIDYNKIKINDTEVHVDLSYVTKAGHESDSYAFFDRSTGYGILVVKGKFTMRCDYNVKPDPNVV